MWWRHFLYPAVAKALKNAIAAAEIEHRLDHGERMASAAHAIAETCVVLTRLLSIRSLRDVRIRGR